MTYPEAIQYLESFINYEKIPAFSYQESLKLERMKGFLALLGDPQEDLRCLHIAGTKGKGSVCAFASYILREAGFRVGLYTSPHLSDFRERIRILNPKSETNKKSRIKKLEDFEGMISKRAIAGLAEKIKPAIEKYNRNCEYGTLTFFEVYTALAFLYFKHKKVDYAVLETGLGGRLDATNTINPLVCAITPISYDHTAQLGNTIKKIAAEKSGIIKAGNGERIPIVISAQQAKEARTVIRNRCKKTGARLCEIGKDIVWHKTQVRSPEMGYRLWFQSFSVKGIKGNYDNLKIGLLGEYQIGNAALAIGMVEALAEGKVTESSIRRGLRKTVWPGRLEIASGMPRIALDGAHNTASAAALKKALKNNFEYKNLILVLGMSKDKDIKGVCDILSPMAHKIILTKSVNPRLAEPESIQKILHKPAVLTYNIKEAIAMAKKSADPQDLILITGSLFVAGEARIWLKTH